MKNLDCNNVSISESGDEYFQVSFDQGNDSTENYLLLQRGFESEEFEGPSYYIESDDEIFIGHNILKEAVLTRNSFYIKLNNSQESELKVVFDIPGKDFEELRNSLRTVFIGFEILKFEIG